MARRPDIARRGALLDELRTIVLEDGFEALRIGALADRLRCSRSTLYKLAPTKEELVVAVVSRFIGDATFAAIGAAAAAEKYADKLSAYYAEIEQWRAKGSDTFWREVSADRSTSRLVLDAQATAFEVIKGLVEEGVAAGEFRECNPGIIAALVVGVRPALDGDAWRPPFAHEELLAEIRRLLATERAA